MRGTVPRLVCPECGQGAGREQQFYLDRRRPRLIVLGWVIAILALLLGAVVFISALHECSALW